jgi:hypothetical protein
VLEATELVQLGCGVDDEPGKTLSRKRAVYMQDRPVTPDITYRLTYHSDSFTDSAAILMSCIHIFTDARHTQVLKP